MLRERELVRYFAVGDIYALAREEKGRRGSRRHVLKVYVSSTPGDSELERSLLLRRVLPGLQAQLGVDLQLIDLRLSCTRDEVDTVHAALEEHLYQMNSCNVFLSLLGDCLGYSPLPRCLRQETMKALLKQHSDNNEICNLLQHWFILDSNYASSPPLFRLRPLSDLNDATFRVSATPKLHRILAGLPLTLPPSAPFDSEGLGLVVGQSLCEAENLAALRRIDEKSGVGVGPSTTARRKSRQGPAACYWFKRSFLLSSPDQCPPKHLSDRHMASAARRLDGLCNTLLSSYASHASDEAGTGTGTGAQRREVIPLSVPLSAYLGKDEEQLQQYSDAFVQAATLVLRREAERLSHSRDAASSSPSPDQVRARLPEGCVSHCEAVLSHLRQLSPSQQRDLSTAAALVARSPRERKIVETSCFSPLTALGVVTLAADLLDDAADFLSSPFSSPKGSPSKSRPGGAGTTEVKNKGKGKDLIDLATFAGQPSVALVVTGALGAGKSTIMAALARQLSYQAAQAGGSSSSASFSPSLSFLQGQGQGQGQSKGQGQRAASARVPVVPVVCLFLNETTDNSTAGAMRRVVAQVRAASSLSLSSSLPPSSSPSCSTREEEEERERERAWEGEDLEDEDALPHLFVSTMRRQPVLLLVDNAHLLTGLSPALGGCDLIDALAGARLHAKSRVVLSMPTRELRERQAGLASLGLAPLPSLELQRLGRDEGEAMLVSALAFHGRQATPTQLMAALDVLFSGHSDGPGGAEEGEGEREGERAGAMPADIVAAAAVLSLPGSDANIVSLELSPLPSENSSSALCSRACCGDWPVGRTASLSIAAFFALGSGVFGGSWVYMPLTLLALAPGGLSDREVVALMEKDGAATALLSTPGCFPLHMWLRLRRFLSPLLELIPAGSHAVAHSKQSGQQGRGWINCFKDCEAARAAVRALPESAALVPHCFALLGQFLKTAPEEIE